MPRITLGNRLYVYQLLSRELGIGRQTMLSRVEEVLAGDDLMPSDMECADVRELLEALDDFVRLTVFKKGRVYATVISVPAWDEILARVNEPVAEKKPAKAGGPKTWKRKRAGKDPRPAKPRPHGRPKPVVEEADKSADDRAVDVPADQAASTGLPAPAEQTASPIPPASEAQAASPAVATSDNEPSAELEPTSIPAAEPIAEPEKTVEQSTKPELTAPIASSSEAEDTTAQTPKASAEPAPEPAATPEPEPEPAAAPEPAPAPTPAPTLTPSITLTVTYTPDEPDYEDEAFLSPTPAPAPAPAPEPNSEQTSAPAPEPAAAPAATPAAPEAPKAQGPIIPECFSREVHCGNEQLSALYQILPLDVDPVALLDDDWNVAHSTNTYTAKGGLVTFPLRYLTREGGDPVTVAMRRGARRASGKRWLLENVGGTEADAELLDVGLDGLPQSDGGAWSDLSPRARTAEVDKNPLRELSRYAVLGAWDALLKDLADFAAPEDWGDDHAVLREYLALTFHRAQHENKLVTAPDQQRTSFDTGLLTERAERIFMQFAKRSTRREGSIAWEFDGFATTDDLGAQPVAYIATLDAITLAAPCEVTPARAIANAYGAQLDAAIDVACKRAQRSYRVATPAYDPATDGLRLLLPIEFADKTGALVLEPHAPGSYRATAILSLERAYTCARAVSAELPRWLRP